MVCGPSAHNGVVIHLLAAAAAVVAVAGVSRIHMHLLSPLALSRSLFLSLSIRVHVLCPQTVLSHGLCCHLPVLQYQSTVPVHPPTHNPTNSYTHPNPYTPTRPDALAANAPRRASNHSLQWSSCSIHHHHHQPFTRVTSPPQSCTLSVSQSVSQSVGRSSPPSPTQSIHPSIHPSIHLVPSLCPGR